MCVLWRGINIGFFLLCPILFHVLSWILFQFLLIFFLTRETTHIISPCDKPKFKVCARNSMKSMKYILLNLKFLWNATSPSITIGSFSVFFTRGTSHIVPPCNKTRMSNFCLEFYGILRIPQLKIFFESIILLQLLVDHSEIFTVLAN